MRGPLFAELRRALDADEPVALATVTDRADGVGDETVLASKLIVQPGEPVLGTLGHPELDRVVARDALAALDLGVTVTRRYGPHGEAWREDVAVLLEVFVRRARLVLFGAVDFTRALVEVGRVLGYAVTVCDARAVFATDARFPMADEVVVDWPDRYLARVGRISDPVTPCASSPMTRSSTYRPSWRRSPPRSATWVRWDHAAPMSTDGSACSRRERRSPSYGRG